jgi:hypothetical protein
VAFGLDYTGDPFRHLIDRRPLTPVAFAMPGEIGGNTVKISQRFHMMMPHITAGAYSMKKNDGGFVFHSAFENK